ncbi:hypothetical protein Pmani_003832 [Petrolisthes manimaculis]|uniref:Uncharacterized protein n=1 Tax=Petrolisthes manimaculis TaxID=1843537 RepID=A0AAE1QFG7_9EUCA|nr:hypothetical protein Pmani_003832 [Petrolisthes manimaculis]
MDVRELSNPSVAIYSLPTDDPLNVQGGSLVKGDLRRLVRICEGQACSSLPQPRLRCGPQHLHDAILTFQITSGSSTRLPRPKNYQTDSQPASQTPTWSTF